MPFGKGLVHEASEHTEPINFYLSISINRTTLPVWFEPSSYRLRYMCEQRIVFCVLLLAPSASAVFENFSPTTCQRFNAFELEPKKGTC